MRPQRLAAALLLALRPRLAARPARADLAHAGHRRRLVVG